MKILKLEANLVPRVFSLAWGRDGKSQGKDPGNEVALLAQQFFQSPPPPPPTLGV